MIVVNNCPTNLAEIAKASKRLDCKHDTYGNNQYLCVPDLNKTSLVELCFDGIMGIHKEKHCVAAAEKSLVEISCLNFSSGCPNNHHWTFEFYKYPACQNINTRHHCYVMEPSCPHQVPDEDTGNQDTMGPNWIILAVILVLLILALVGFFIFRLIQKKLAEDKMNQRQRHKKSSDMVDDFITSIESFQFYTKDTMNQRQRHKKSSDMVDDFITSIESFQFYTKDKEHCEHDCEPYLIHKEKSLNVIENGGDCFPPNNTE